MGNITKEEDDFYKKASIRMIIFFLASIIAVTLDGVEWPVAIQVAALSSPICVIALWPLLDWWDER